MDCIHVDNAKEFRGDMLRRACERYGIELNFRPVGQPHFGGHVERFFNTMAGPLHKLPGTTFSNVPERGEYPSERKACFTLEELEQLIGKWIIGIYHNQLHRGIHMSPLKKYREGFSEPAGRPLPPVITDTDQLQRDFMPVVYRTIQRTGVEIDNVRYYGPELQRWVGSREKEKSRSRLFSFARDPRDISRIYFLDPEDNQYREIPYLDTSRGPISLWELRSANEKLRAEGRRGINEHLLFEKHFELLDQARSTVKKTKAARRKVQAERRRAASPNPKQTDSEAESAEPEAFLPEFVEIFDDQPVLPFEVERL